MRTIKIFGYGSLINKESLRKSVKSARNIVSGRVYGFIRVFNVFEDRQLTRKNCGEIAVLNVEKSEFNQFINGVCFDMDFDEFENLQKREKQYELVGVDVVEIGEENVEVRAFMWRANHFDVFDYQFDSLAQKEYLELCLKGCCDFGEEFLDEFKKTTFIGKKTVKELEMEGKL